MDSMDSVLHSSCGRNTAAEEHSNSRTESISSFFNPTHQPTFLDSPSSSYLPPLNPTNIPKPDYYPLWTRNIRLDDATNCLNSQPLVFSSNTNMGRAPNHYQVGVSTKKQKKRTRASKRPPTTVLTTDTSNFRQMVQEFTGIPTAPFSSYSHRYDRIGGGGMGPWYRVPPARPKIQLQQPSYTTLSSQNPKFLFQEFGNQQSDVLRGLAGSSTHWRGASENLLPKQDGYELNKLNVDHPTHKGFESVISLRDGGDQAQDQTQVNADSWVLPF
ncbi:putative VQ motif-containing protein [Helianthus annuus]|nr:putative VQ motif-containing protein [Helianthus annuus]KAJ0926275.1 putative VQ motif-containing protein [Helianthus annuus]